MGKNAPKGNPKNRALGKVLIKDKRASAQKHHRGGDDWKHTSDIQDGYEWNRINLKSVTEQDTLNDFLDTAAMAGKDFTAEKMNIKVISTGSAGLLGEDEKTRIKNLQDEHKGFIKIPRRPEWDENTSAEQLDLREKESFLNWRRSLAMLQEKQQLLLTPYEKNLDVWRQLWRVIERSDIVCQIVDGRNPLLYKCDDLEVYVKETNPNKKFVVLVNKADYLSENQRMCWAEYFEKRNVKVVFWSALDELSNAKEGEDEEDEDEGVVEEEDEEEEDEEDDTEQSEDSENELDSKEKVKTESEVANKVTVFNNKDESVSIIDMLFEDPTRLLSQKELLQYFKTFQNLDADKSYVMVGLVGYPNVGKSSTINALLQDKKTAVSATPGKTKHYQTHFLDPELCLCDCPGLVFPSFVFTKADLVLNGILPSDQMRDHLGPIGVLAQHIPKNVIESTYGINIPQGGIQNNEPPSAEQILSSYAKMRGFMTSSGQPDCPRASRYLVKDYLKGKLLYCHPPPGAAASKFEQSQVSGKVLLRLKAKEAKAVHKTSSMESSPFDDEFFCEKQPNNNAHYNVPTQGIKPNETGEIIYKPWKKHHNRNKREKLRRIYDDNN